MRITNLGLKLSPASEHSSLFKMKVNTNPNYSETSKLVWGVWKLKKLADIICEQDLFASYPEQSG